MGSYLRHARRSTASATRAVERQPAQSGGEWLPTAVRAGERRCVLRVCVCALLEPERATPLVDREAQEIRVGYARNFDRVLEGEEDALLGALLRLILEQVIASVVHSAASDLV